MSAQSFSEWVRTTNDVNLMNELLTDNVDVNCKFPPAGRLRSGGARGNNAMSLCANLASSLMEDKFQVPASSSCCLASTTTAKSTCELCVSAPAALKRLITATSPSTCF